MSNLANMYATGRGVARDDAKAIELYEKAAQANIPWACFRYAAYLESGVGIARDEVEAAKWYSKAAEQGHTGAQTRLVLLEYRAAQKQKETKAKVDDVASCQGLGC